MIPYIFAHRGASGYEIENTIPSFKKAVVMGAGIETDVQLTKDNKIVCFHDPYIQINENYHVISNITFKELNKIKFEDNRKIPLLKDVFEFFKDNSDKLRYSFDILNANTGISLLKLASKMKLSDNIEITDRRLTTLSRLRRQFNSAELVYTLSELMTKFSDRLLNKLKKLSIHTVNIRCRRNINYLFEEAVDYGLRCYIWGVNTKLNMKRVINLTYKDETVNAIYTDYPDLLLNLVMEHFK